MPAVLINAFNTYFDMIPANTEPLEQEVYRLRYHVYCSETGLESPDNCPNELERDEFDEISEHFLIRHKRSGEFAATTRLILPDPTNPNRLFPIETHCVIDRTDLIGSVPREKLGEVSRFCVSKTFKRRHGEAGTVAGIGPDTTDRFIAHERRTFPHITLALFTCLIRINRRHRLTHWIAVMEPALIRFLAYIGIYPTPIGPLVDYHGIRQPCIIEVDYLLDGVKQKNPDAWEFITNHGNDYQGYNSAI